MLLQERVEKSKPRHKLPAEETKLLAKLGRGENEQNRQLQTWLSEEKYLQI